MPTGPRKIILIRSGRYEYAEIDMDGALQIVGPNNTGKTTLINTLQFLYLDDRRHMDFGSYTVDQTKEFYFPGQYSYVLFECLGASGSCVLGWRGQSKTGGGEPERFYHLGPYATADFLDDRGQVREPRDVSARLALKDYRVLKSAQEHREILLASTHAGSRGLGIVSLRDNDKYHQFRETLKCLLTLSAITQEQMRDRLLMLADIPPDRTALDIRALFGEDYDRIRERRERLIRFKKNQPLVQQLVEKFSEREAVRGGLVWRWAGLRLQRQRFERSHDAALVKLREEAKTQEEKGRVLAAELADRRAELNSLAEQKGALASQLAALAAKDKEFAQYAEELESAALSNLDAQIRSLQNQLAHAEAEPREKVRQKLELYGQLVTQKEQTISRFDHLAVTALRRHFNDDELNAVFRILNPALLELPLGKDAIEVKRESEVLALLRVLLKHSRDGAYEDANVEIQLPSRWLPLGGLDNVASAREQLQEYRGTLEHWQSVLNSIEQREKLAESLKLKQAERQEGERRLFRFEEYRKQKADGPRLEAEQKAVGKAIEAADARVRFLEGEIQAAGKAEVQARNGILREEDAFNQVMNRFANCIFPEFDVPAKIEGDAPDDFDAAIAVYVKEQERQGRLADEAAQLLVEVERWFGEEFRGEDDRQTVSLLREELEALPDKEEALARDWNAHIHGLKATFDRVLKELGEVQSAKDALNRQFAKVQVSNLQSLRMEVIEQSDLVSWIRRLASFEPGGLFENDPERESALVNFRTKLQDNPIVHFADLFTLGVTVLGPDGRKHRYHDLRQIESHGTTVAIKVLFNLLLLKSQMKRDDCLVPFFLDEIQILDPANRHAILATARKLGFLAITAAPEAVSEVDALYFLQPRRGWIVVRNKHRVGVKLRPAPPGAQDQSPE